MFLVLAAVLDFCWKRYARNYETINSKSFIVTCAWRLLNYVTCFSM